MSHLRGIIILNDSYVLLAPLQDTLWKTYYIQSLAYGHLQFSEVFLERDVVKLKSRLSNDVRQKYYEHQRKTPESVFHLRYVRQLENLVNTNATEVLILVDQPDEETLKALNIAFDVPIVTIFRTETLTPGTIELAHGKGNNPFIKFSTRDLRTVRKIKTLIPSLLKLQKPPEYWTRFIMGLYLLFTITIFLRNGLFA